MDGNKSQIKYMDKFQYAIIITIVSTFAMFIVLLVFRLIFLDDLPKRGLVDSLISINSATHFLAWAWFIVRSITYRMRLNEAIKEQEDI